MHRKEFGTSDSRQGGLAISIPWIGACSIAGLAAGFAGALNALLGILVLLILSPLPQWLVLRGLSTGSGWLHRSIGGSVLGLLLGTAVFGLLTAVTMLSGLEHILSNRHISWMAGALAWTFVGAPAGLLLGWIQGPSLGLSESLQRSWALASMLAVAVFCVSNFLVLHMQLSGSPDSNVVVLAPLATGIGSTLYGLTTGVVLPRLLARRPDNE